MAHTIRAHEDFLSYNIHFFPKNNPLAQKKSYLTNDRVADLAHKNILANVQDRQAIKLTRTVKPIYKILKESKSKDYLNSLPLEFKMIAEQMELLLTKKNAHHSTVYHLRSCFLFILRNLEWNLSKKYAEIGILFFYIANEHPIPSDTSLLLARFEELHSKALLLKFEHKVLCTRSGKKILPSGAVFYLLRTFVHNIFMSDGSFNLAGCYSVKELLNTSLNSFLSEECRAQILTIVDRLIEDPDFRKLFNESFAIHPTLVELILIDLKLSFDQQVNFIHIRCDLLLALFFSPYQLDEENCYAVAIHSHAMLCNYDVLLKTLREVLQTGMFSFQENQIPIVELITSKRRYEKDFETLIDSKNAQQLTGYLVAKEMFSHVPMPKNTHIASGIRPLKDVIQDTFGLYSGFAMEIFLSHKYNLLQQTLLAILQFISSNSNVKGRVADTAPSISWRSYLFKQLKSKVFSPFIDRTIYLSNVDCKEFVLMFYELFEEHFFLIDFDQWNKTVKEGHIKFDYHTKGLKFYGTLDDYNPFMKTRRLFFLDGGRLKPVDSITFLRKCLIKIHTKAASFFDSPAVKMGQNILNLFLHSSEFKKKIAHVIHTQNGNGVAFPSSFYKKSNAFFLIQRGGSCRLITLWEPLKNRYAAPSRLTSADLSTFFTSLCNAILTFVEKKPDFLMRHDPQIMVGTTTHAFNLNPLHFRTYWKNENHILTYLVLPAHRILNSHIDYIEMLRAVFLTIDTEEAEHLMKNIPCGHLKPKQFQEEVKKLLPNHLHKNFDQSLERVLLELHSTQILKDIPLILLNNDVKIDQSKLNIVKDFFKTYIKTRTFLVPYEIAKILHKALLHNECAYFVSIYQLEEWICRFYNLPHVIDLGNLNWTEEFREKLDYYRFVMKFDILRQKLILCKRLRGHTTPLPKSFVKSILSHFELYLESDSRKD